MRAAGGAVFHAMFNAGQYCSGLERCYVVEEVADRFIALVVEEVKKLKLGSEGFYDIAPMIWDKQLEKVEAQVDEALARGARALVGGRRVGPFFEPTVLVDVDHDMRVMREETFGPVAAVTSFETEEEVVARANATEYGLVAYVVTESGARQLRLGRALDYGMVAVNRVKITGVTKGRGFQGVVHRHHFGGGPQTHGNTRHRKPGSIAPGTDPSRIIKGKRMPGHMGARRFTELGLRVVKVDVDRHLLFVGGSVAGPMNGLLTVRKQGGKSRHD